VRTVLSTTASTSVVAPMRLAKPGGHADAADNDKPPTSALSNAATARTNPIVATPERRTGSAPDGIRMLPLSENLTAPGPVLGEVKGNRRHRCGRPSVHVDNIPGVRLGNNSPGRSDRPRRGAGTRLSGAEAAQSDSDLHRAARTTRPDRPTP
jgi:hypothetical protein